MIDLADTKPNSGERLSKLTSLLSPITKYSPTGTISGPKLYIQAGGCPVC